MAFKGIKSILVAVFSLFILLFSNTLIAQEHPQEPAHEGTEAHEAKEEKLDPAKIILDHIKDAHEFHFFTIENKENPHESFHASIPLPVIVYQPGKGVSMFSSSRFGHGGHEEYKRE